MAKILTVDKALELLGEANKLNPGQWYEHSLVVGRVSGKIAEALNLDSDKAMAFGYIHDIGRRVGRCGLKHIYEGYKYLNDLGYTEAARICLTHSFFEEKIEDVIGKWDISKEKKAVVEDYIINTKFDIYDKIVQLADSISLPTGITTLERRMTDVFFRYGFNDKTEYNFKIRLELQDEIEEMLGYPLYRLFIKEISEELNRDMVADVVKFK